MAETANRTKGVDILTGDPKKAIVAMMVPITVALLIQSLNSVINAIWVAGLGTAALAAVGVFFPVYFILVAVGNGIGVGASQAIARRIGEGDAEGADNAAMHSVVMTAVAAVLMTVLMLLLAKPLISVIGGAEIVEECLHYAYPVLIGSVILFFSGLMSSILRSEGAAKRSMTIQILGAVVNIVLDPILIYVFGWGLTGAGIATVIATATTLLPCLYWYKVKKDTYLKLRFKSFRYDKKIMKDISAVGLPAAAEMILISVVSMIMNAMVLFVGGTAGVAVYTGGWRVINLLMIPLMAISSAIVPVCAAGFGANRYDRIKVAFNFSLKLITVLMFVILIAIWVLAPYAVYMFTYSDSTAALREEMTYMVRMVAIFLPFAGIGFVASGFFQSLGMGMKSLVSAIIRNGLQVPICLALAGSGILGHIWWGITFAEAAGSIFMGAWGILVLRALMKNWKPPKDVAA